MILENDRKKVITFRIVFGIVIFIIIIGVIIYFNLINKTDDASSKNNQNISQGSKSNEDEETIKRLMDNFESSKQLGMNVGNIYTASLYMSLLSLLENAKLAPNSLIGLFSYGSGAMAEFFSGNTIDGYEKQLDIDGDQKLLSRRRKLSIEEYERIFTVGLDLPEDGIVLESDESAGNWYFAGTENNVRIYKQK